MKNNKIKFIGLSLVLLIAIAGCTPSNTNMRNLGTQTRPNNNVNNRWMGNNRLMNNRDRLNTNLNNGMVRNNTNLNNDTLGNNTNLDNGMVRNNTSLNNGMMTNDQLNNNNIISRANMIAQRVAALPEVNRASVLISGDRAIVGCDVKNNTANTINANLRNKIEAAVKAADKNIKTVSITSDPNLNTRIQTLSTQINNGNPISNFTNEIEDIFRRIITPSR